MPGLRFAIGLAVAGFVVYAVRGERIETDLSGPGWTADGEPVSVPHTWNVLDGADGEGRGDPKRPNDSAGAGSYVRKRVVYRHALPAKASGRRYFVRCEGASIVAEMRVNGKDVGRHEGAFTAFCFEVTEAMNAGGNELEIAVDNSFDEDIQPIDGDFTMYGGLYRPVRLIETDPVCVDPVTDGANGLVAEADPKTGRVTVKVRVLGGEDEVQAFDIPGWKPWSPEEPNVYPIAVTIRRGTSTDTVRETVGFRTVEFREDGFLYLNGEKRILRGVNRHQDRKGKGWAVSAADEAEDVDWIKRMGADAVRTSHYPQSPAFYSLCDRKGLLVWTEVPNVNRMSFSARGRANRLLQAREMVAQHRNRPSVVMWGLYNELYSSNYSMKPLSAEREIALVRDLIRSLDPSRPTVAATSRPERPELSALPTALGVNVYPGWYGGDADTMNEDIEAVLFVTDRPAICVSEYGAGGSFGQHADARARPAARGPFHPCEYQAWVHRGNYRRIVESRRVWGSFAWEMFDSGADVRREGAANGWNDKGLVTGDRRNAKDAFWFYRANWVREPVLHLVGEEMSEVKGDKATVVGFCNAGSVTLVVNGATVGAKEPDSVKSAVWEDVPLRPGDNAIELRSGDLVSRATWRVR